MSWDNSETTSNPKGGAAVASTTGNLAAFCPRCHLPLTQQGSSGECLRCVVRMAFWSDEDQGDSAIPIAEATTGRTLQYGQFEIVVSPDGTPVELGSGGMATTYRARDMVLDCSVALKVIDRRVAGHPSARARFLREARAAAKLHHPHIANVTHYGEQNGECYYAMELVEGETLDARVKRYGPFSPALTLEVGVQIARALVAAEAYGVVHRDLKPSNVMLTSRPGGSNESDTVTVKLIDWGLAKAAGAESSLGVDHTFGGFVGTPAFASPEQVVPALDKGVDTRSDIYSLGVTLWYLLCGRTPFTGQTLDDIHGRQLHDALPVEQLAAAHVPKCFLALLRSMLAADPNVRPQTGRELLTALRKCQNPVRSAHRLGMLAGAAALVVLLCSLGWWLFHTRSSTKAPDQSIAVLPFENLSPDKTDSFFTVGFQDEVSADLSRIATLKVIGSNSTRSYSPENRDLGKIGRELGVTHVLEGSVRRADGKMRITVRMMNCLSNKVDWLETYDQPLENVFAVQGEITHAFASRLQGSLSKTENVALSVAPTKDLKAYDLYLRARDGASMWANRASARRDNQHKIELLNEAVVRDPSFVLAYCELAKAHGKMFDFRAGASAEELSVDHRSLAEVALEKARRLQPNSGELHLAQAYHFYRVTKDVEQARIEVDAARAMLPNNAELEFLSGNIALSLGRSDDAIRAFMRATALDPRSKKSLYWLAQAYSLSRRYQDYERTMARLSAIYPTKSGDEFDVQRAFVQAEASADTAPVRTALAAAVAAGNAAENDKEIYGLLFALWDRDPDAISRLLSTSKLDSFSDFDVSYPKAWFEAFAARLRGDAAGNQAALATARGGVEKALMIDPTSGRTLGLLAMIDAGLGHKEEAVREARRAGELVAKSALDAPVVACDLAVVYAWTSQPDRAFAVLDEWITRPTGGNALNQPTYGDFKLNPIWDSLRADPRFTALVKRLAP
ncbi:MAG: protein kinase [Chthoniobacterales bacterium]|nr:protein kinase [Chthoniobacterales bacterium]